MCVHRNNEKEIHWIIITMILIGGVGEGRLVGEPWTLSTQPAWRPLLALQPKAATDARKQMHGTQFQ